jgi:hypothetical protein
MRVALLGVYLILAILLPKIGTAQVAYRPTPQVTAANATWQINGEPIFFAGSLYYPAGPRVFFDGQLMARVGEYLTVPLYADTTHEAFSRVLVPIGGAVMKPYDRRRAGPLSGTVGSTTPAWPVQVASNALQTPGGAGNPTGEPLVLPDVPPSAARAEDSTQNAVGTTGSTFARPPLARTAVQSVPRPTANTGISVIFQGARWVSDGPAVPFSPDRYLPIGDHHGFPVYREKQGSSDTIYVTVVADGPLAPYRRQ